MARASEKRDVDAYDGRTVCHCQGPAGCTAVAVATVAQAIRLADQAHPLVAASTMTGRCCAVRPHCQRRDETRNVTREPTIRCATLRLPLRLDHLAVKITARWKVANSFDEYGSSTDRILRAISSCGCCDLDRALCYRSAYRDRLDRLSHGGRRRSRNSEYVYTEEESWRKRRSVR